MKKLVSLLLVAVMVLAVASLAACTEDDTKYLNAECEIALVTDVGNIDDKSFNEGAWNGVKEYAKENEKTFAYFRPSEDSTAARVETIEAAIEKGAKVVVCPGFLFDEAIYNVQDKHPDVYFLLLDGEPHTADYSTYKTSENTYCILYKEEQAGYLAGYAAVKDGYTKLGFLGGMSVPAVIRYGYGFVQGAEAAAQEMNVDVEMNYWYSGVFSANDDIKTKMDAWFTAGTEVVFSCGGGIYLSAVAAAEATDNGKVIGVDVDQAAESDRIITSAMKGLTVSVKLALATYYENGNWGTKGGTTANLGAAEDCVGLPTASGSWRMNNFKVEEYNALFAKIKSGEIAVSNAVETAPVTEKVTVDYQNKAEG